MTQTEVGNLLHLIHNPEPEQAVCQKCMDFFIAKDDELFCPHCEDTMTALDRANILYAIEHGIEREKVLYHIMNGDGQ